MFELDIHKAAQKAFQKAPQKIKKKIFICLDHFREKGLSELPFAIKPLQGSFKNIDIMK